MRKIIIVLLIMFIGTACSAQPVYEKINDGTLKVTFVETQEQVWDINKLVEIRDALVEQKQQTIEEFDERIADIELLITEAEKLGIEPD